MQHRPEGRRNQSAGSSQDLEALPEGLEKFAGLVRQSPEWDQGAEGPLSQLGEQDDAERGGKDHHAEDARP